MPARRDVAVAVAALLDEARPGEVTSVFALVPAVSRMLGREIQVVDDSELAGGVSGLWERHGGGDRISLGRWVLSRPWTCAHELGHAVLGHQGHALPAEVRGLRAATPSLRDRMLGRARLVHFQREDAAASEPLTPEQQAEEDDAELFAGLLLTRLEAIAGASSPSLRAKLNDTLG